MMIPNPNISAYRKQFSTPNNRYQLMPTICNEDVRNPRMIGMQRAMFTGFEDEGARYRGYGAYGVRPYQANTLHCNCNNIYCPLYYNDKSSYQGKNDWFIADANLKLTSN